MPFFPSGRPSLFPLTPAVLALAGLALCLRACGLGLGDAAEPGPGLWPAFVGGGLVLCGGLLALPVRAAQRRAPAPPSSASPADGAAPAFPASPCPWADGRPRPDVRALKGMGLGCALWIALLLPLGWLPATLLAGLIFGRAAGNGTRDVLIPLALLIAGLRLGVEEALRFPLPGGLWSRAVDALSAWLCGAGGPP